ncbi:MAG: AbrB/MazE/SpoVT family DNA-binding domain-containing protein [Smithella sp.]
METVKSSGLVDNEGRVTLPEKIRKALKLEPGSTVLIELESDKNVIHIRPALDDLLLVIAKQAEEDYAAGKTRNLREYAREHGIDEC